VALGPGDARRPPPSVPPRDGGQPLRRGDPSPPRRQPPGYFSGVVQSVTWAILQGPGPGSRCTPGWGSCSCPDPSWCWGRPSPGAAGERSRGPGSGLSASWRRGSTGAASSSPTCPSSPLTTSACEARPGCWSTPSVIWPGSPPRGGISSGGSTPPRCPVAPPGRRSSAPRGPHRDAYRGTPSEHAPMEIPRWGAPQGPARARGARRAHSPGRLRPGRPALARPHRCHLAPLAHRRPLQALAGRR
jgi:hypothetical protein